MFIQILKWQFSFKCLLDQDKRLQKLEHWPLFLLRLLGASNRLQNIWCCHVQPNKILSNRERHAQSEWQYHDLFYWWRKIYRLKFNPEKIHQRNDSFSWIQAGQQNGARIYLWNSCFNDYWNAADTILWHCSLQGLNKLYLQWFLPAVKWEGSRSKQCWTRKTESIIRGLERWMAQLWTRRQSIVCILRATINSRTKRGGSLGQSFKRKQTN